MKFTTLFAGILRHKWIFLALILLIMLTLAYVGIMFERYLLIKNRLVIPKDTLVVSWDQVKILAGQCDISQLGEGHSKDWMVLRDGRGFTVEGSPGRDWMSDLVKSHEKKCGFVSVGME